MIMLWMMMSWAASAQKNINLMPIPKSVQWLSGDFTILTNFNISINSPSNDTLLLKAVNRVYQQLNRKTGIYFNTDYIKFSNKSDSASLQIITKKVVQNSIGVDESYTLNISSSKVMLEANTGIGAMRGLETLLQLCEKKAKNFVFPAVSIVDEPKLQWRGLMIDVARHFIPIDVLERNIEAMASVKMNVLHLHLTDDQGFRVESKVFPQFHKKGSNGEYYTQEQIVDLVKFAQERGIIIIPEFDMPGHTKSWFAAYPLLSSFNDTFEPGPPVDFSQIKEQNMLSIVQFMKTAPFPAMNPANEQTYLFLDKFLAEMAKLFPAPYIHIGADENNGVAWKNNPSIVEFMQKNKINDTHLLQAYFVNRVYQLVKKYNKAMIGWEELFSSQLPKDVFVQVWQNPTFINKSTENGNPTLISKGFYLDLFMPAYIHYNNPDFMIKNGIKGGEAAQWTEIADKFNIETRIWPRAAAIAERFWSVTESNDIEELYRRLAVLNKHLDFKGLGHISAYEKALRFYASEQNVNDLKVLTDVLTPIKGYKKLFAKMTQPRGMTLQTAPLNEISDIIAVDSEIKWKFRSAVKSFLNNKDSDSEKLIINYLTRWQGLDKKLAVLMENSTPLARVQEHAKNLSAIAKLGEQALEHIKLNYTPSTEWANEAFKILKEASKSFGDTELAVVAEIESLLKQQMTPIPKSFPIF